MKKNHAVTARAARLNPVPGDAYESLPDSAEGRQMVEQIVRAPGRERGAVLGPVPRSVAWVAIAGVALVTAVAVLARNTAPLERPQPRWAPALVEIAEDAPRLLVGAKGWEVVGATEFEGRQGEMYFDNGRSCMDAGAAPGCYWLSLNWYPAETFEDYRKDRATGASRDWEITIAGETATVFRHHYPARERTAGIEAGVRENPLTFYALWVDGDHWLELRSDVFPTAEEFTTVAETVYAVDVDTWLSALPSSVVEPDERGDEVDRLLADVPVPPDLDVAALRGELRVSDGLDYEVATAVVCGWIDRWAEAAKSGDRAGEREAVDALATARGWRVFRDRGQLAAYVFEVADSMEADEPLDGYGSLPRGKAYKRHVGCHEG